MNRTARRDQTRTKMADNIAMLAMQIETLEENDEFLHYDQTGPIAFALASFIL